MDFEWYPKVTPDDSVFFCFPFTVPLEVIRLPVSFDPGSFYSFGVLDSTLKRRKKLPRLSKKGNSLLQLVKPKEPLFLIFSSLRFRGLLQPLPREVSPDGTNFGGL